MRKLLCLACLLALLAACTPAPTGEATASPAPPPLEETRTVTLVSRFYAAEDIEWAKATSEAINQELYKLGSPLRLEIKGYPEQSFVPEIHPFSLVVTGTAPRVDSKTGKILPEAPIDLVIDSFALAPTYLEQGIIRDLSADLTAYVDLYATTPERAWRETLIDGKIVCFPLIRGLEANAAETEITFRRDVLDELEAEAPTTPEALLALLRRAKESGMRHQLVLDMEAPLWPLHRTYEEWPFMVDAQSRFIFWPDGRVEAYVGSSIFEKDRAFMTALADERLLSIQEMIDDGGPLEIRPGYIVNRLQNESMNRIAAAILPRVVPRAIMVPTATALFAPEAERFRMSGSAEYAIYVSSFAHSKDDALQMLEMLYTVPEIARLLFGDAEGEGAKAYDPSGRYFHEGAAVESPIADATMEFPGSGFVFNELPIAEPAWQGIHFADTYALRMGFLDEDIDTVVRELNENGYQQMLIECEEQYREYIERCTVQ